MLLKRLLLQNFRSYLQADFSFSEQTTFIIGPNTAGKSNIIEAIYLLSTGKSFRTEKDQELIKFGENICRVKGAVIGGDKQELEVTLADGSITQKQNLTKKYQLNSLPKRRVDFAGTFPTLLFEPSDLDMVSGSPGLRREFLDEVLEQVDRDYRRELITYTKALRQRNALLQRTRESGVRIDKQFAYWDEIVITSGGFITKKREEFILHLNEANKDLFLLDLSYDPSAISEERLLLYKDAEVAAGVTLVGPHRDDFLLSMKKQNEESLSLKSFGSRGQQRLGVLQLKLLQLEYMGKVLGAKPTLLLDDIFSELDEVHIKHILDVVKNQQTIITTTHKEFLDAAGLTKSYIIEL